MGPLHPSFRRNSIGMVTRPLVLTLTLNAFVLPIVICPIQHIGAMGQDLHIRNFATIALRLRGDPRNAHPPLVLH